MEFKPSQKHSNKTNGIHYLVPNILKLDILQAKSCFLEQQTLCLYETFRSACLYFSAVLLHRHFQHQRKEQLSALKTATKHFKVVSKVVKTFKSGFKTIFTFPFMHLSILTEINLLVTSSSFSHCVSRCTFSTHSHLFKEIPSQKS